MTSRPIRNFLELVGILQRGVVAEKLNEALATTVETLQALPGGKGKAVITLTVEVACDQDRIDVLPAIKCKLPEDKAFARTPFWAFEGALSTQHPSQMDMWGAPRDATAPRAEPAADRA
ncbi:hypothetical protein [Chenggangzhangella methanolivorans]|uniref:Uncharacterized protein n=1 Tax=Chenggangzhangella methanolivorans TaxID=1437009 RepID=A0A9E6R932_9HYPH|nr:hypothetical protein [Chenggangzhangella methanolivorans]QZN99771.1 hypothetical protein K6K41_24410 [Chenggangzhangella methanolivorans]